MTMKAVPLAMALMANGLCLFWPSGTAPNIAPRSARCVMAIRHSVCAASAPCACVFLDGSPALLVLETDCNPERFRSAALLPKG